MTAPTKAEIDAARAWFDDDLMLQLAKLGLGASVRHVRVLLAALDAAEKRADAAEAELRGFKLIVSFTCGANERLFKLLGLPTAELEEMDPLGVEFALTDAVKRLERERDEARAKLKTADDHSVALRRELVAMGDHLVGCHKPCGTCDVRLEAAKAALAKEAPRG